ncbi:acetylglutamate kinase [Oceanobacillus jeddahense]|uniref:Acetylglutamate kinase n=1 Tax=Oceanobacillus jeddahense TaxID=1462527 RepID=A0ABY5JZ79_9BACI|nr:acetylglutamate kinase [Oceanobacillus jeddahense]UUI05104.1 acetylglutamate kinase [Oceanobacillus jeddahense]
MTKVVFKVGGSILQELPKAFYELLIDLKEKKICDPVIVHGGGPEINQALEQMNIESTFIDGLRVTTKEVLEVAQMVMSGTINKRIVRSFQNQNGKAIGLSGVDGRLLQAEPILDGKLGFVGEVTKVETSWIDMILKEGGIPVISPIASGEGETCLNINGDTAAGAVAEALGCKLVLISNIPGVMETVDQKEVIHHHLTKKDVEALIDAGVIYGGMIPKVRSALASLQGGVEESVILNGLEPNDILKYLDGEKVGTILSEKEFEHV